MNVVVQKAVHPQLAGYIHSATSGLLPFIQKVPPLNNCSSLLHFLNQLISRLWSWGYNMGRFRHSLNIEFILVNANAIMQYTMYPV